MPVFLVSFFVASAVGAVPDRIATVRENQRVTLRGSVHSRVAAAVDQGALDASAAVGQMRMVLSPSPAQAAELEQLLEQQRDPASPIYQQWLTPEQFGERFGASDSDLAALAEWLGSHGFTVTSQAKARNWVAFTGTAGAVAAAFRTELHHYQSNGGSHFANASQVSLPAAFAGLVTEVKGLNDFHPAPQRSARVKPDYTTSTAAHYLAPDDLAAIYDIAPLYAAGFDGTGQKLAIAGQTDINLADIRGFRTQFGLAAKDPQLVLFGTDPGVSANDQVEADLDLEWSGAVARNATIVYVYSQDVFESLQYAVDQNLAPVISVSYGTCETGSPASYRSLARQANAEGITWMNSSGDSGAASCDYNVQVATHGPAVLFPADIPEVTAVGGSEFNEAAGSGWNKSNTATGESATGYLPEKAWNDTALGGGIAATGGGVSTLFTKPWWQAGTGVPADGARDVPDVSLTASADHDGYLLYAGGRLEVVGGTSASSPAFAGIVTILNQYLVAKGVQAKPGVGNINPNLYSLAQGSTGVFHDITAGDNIVPCTAGSTGCPVSGSFGYQAGVGYDLVTGLGSVDAFNLVTKWASLPTQVGTTETLIALPATFAQSATTQLTATVKAVSGSLPPTGTVTFSSGGLTLGSAALTAPAGAGTTATASFTAKGSSLAAGVNTIAASLTPTGNFASATATATVTVTVPAVATTTTLTASPLSIAASGSTVLRAAVKAASGGAVPAGTVIFTSAGVTLGSASLSASGTAGSATAALTVSAAKLKTGANSIAASYAGAAAFTASSSAAIGVTVAAPAVATTTTVTANPASLASSASTVLTVTVKPASGTTAPLGSVAVTVGNTTLGTVSLTASGASASGALTVKGTSLAAGSNIITASYAGASAFAASSGTAAVTVTVPPAATTLKLTASPAIFALNASTQMTAAVAASGGAVATGTVTFALGARALGSAPLVNGSALVTVAGSSLTQGTDTITATYAPSGNFSSSSGSAAVTVTAPGMATTTTATANPASIAASASTTISVTVKPASGTTAPAGSVTLTSGSTTLGTASLTSGVATIGVAGSKLAAGTNTITVSYAGSTAFGASSATVQVTVTGAAVTNVALSATRGASTPVGLPVTLKVQEQAGVATVLTGFIVNGMDFSGDIVAFFGTNRLPAKGTLTAPLIVEWSPMPAQLTFTVRGIDGTGHNWSQTATVATGH